MKSSRILVIVLCVLIGLLAVVMSKMRQSSAPQEQEQAAAPVNPKAPQRKADLDRLTDVKAHNWQLDSKLKTIKTGSGLKYQDISAGGGSSPKAGDQVLVDYVGWSSTGRMFDTSLSAKRDPLSFILGRGNVIKGWDEGISTMKIGGVRRLVIPPELAYGKIGAPPDILPDETLVFMVRLIDVRPGAK